MKCFFQGAECRGKVTPAAGAVSSPVVNAKAGYCEAHRAQNTMNARWEERTVWAVVRQRREDGSIR